MSELVIREAGIADCDRIWEIIEKVAPLDFERKINDYNIYHSHESLGKVLSHEICDEIILLALKGEDIAGVVDFKYSQPEYLFFENQFGYIRYLVADGYETRKKLYSEVKVRLKKFNISYVVKDIWISETEEYLELQDLGMKKHRTRLYKEIKKEK